MRLDYLEVSQFKNLQNFSIDFDQSSMSSVLIGENGTGKSNVIEAIITIFRDLDLDTTTPFPYKIRYRCNGHKIEIENTHSSGKINRTIRLGGITTTIRNFLDGRDEFLPAHVFGYYSGSSRRLEILFDRHQTNYYSHVIKADQPVSITELVQEKRRLFYCRSEYGKLALLSYFAFDQDSKNSFLYKHLQIKQFDCALLKLRKPRWRRGAPNAEAKKHGQPHFWYATGQVKALLDALWEHAVAPFHDSVSEKDDYRTQSHPEEQVYIFIKDLETLKSIARKFNDEATFFLLLETLEISDLVRDVQIWVTRSDDENTELPFHEISDGEKQLLSVLGLMRFTGKRESLYLLDEPDTHLNPAWKWNYLSLVDDVANNNGESHLIMTSHDPLTISSLERDQVQVMYEENDQIFSSKPNVHPRGLGVTGVLTQIFGIETTLDRPTQELLDLRNSLLLKDSLEEEEKEQLAGLNNRLAPLGLAIDEREREYEVFLRALKTYKSQSRQTMSPKEIMEQNELALRLIAELNESGAM